MKISARTDTQRALIGLATALPLSAVFTGLAIFVFELATRQTL